MNVQIINKSKHATPSYETEGAAGMDIRANINESIILKTLERVVVKTGLFIALPIGYEAQVRPRSGLAAKKGITVLNSPGTIDADYRGEIGVILVNLSNEDFLHKRWRKNCTIGYSKARASNLGSSGCFRGDKARRKWFWKYWCIKTILLLEIHYLFKTLYSWFIFLTFSYNKLKGKIT